MTQRAEIQTQLLSIYDEIKLARAERDYELVHMLERLAPRFEIEIGPLCTCEACLKAA